MTNSRTDVLGVGFDNISMAQAVEKACDLLKKHAAGYVVTPNPEIVMLCREDNDTACAVNSAAMVIPDGIGVIYGAKLLGTPLREKIPGIDFTSALMDKMQQSAGSVFLLGSKPGVAEKAAENLAAKYPGLQFVGTNDGYFQDDEPIIEKINAVHPDLLLVCLGAPKQEKWMQKNADKLDVGLMIGAGGSLDVYAGVAQRAPELWQRLGLEWLYRLLKQPQRIGRMMRLPKFLVLVIIKRFRG